jgi:hypothetical protein
VAGGQARRAHRAGRRARRGSIDGANWHHPCWCVLELCFALVWMAVLLREPAK